MNLNILNFQRLNVFPMQCVGFDTHLVDVIKSGLEEEQDEHMGDEQTKGKGKKRSRSPELSVSSSNAKKRPPAKRVRPIDKRSQTNVTMEGETDGENIPESEEDESSEEESDYDPGNGSTSRTTASATPVRTRPQRFRG